MVDLLDLYDEPVDKTQFENHERATAVDSEELKSRKKLDLFKDLLPSLMDNKQHILEDDRDYNAYMVNRMMSYHEDCLLYANIMNANWRLDPRLQYDFYLHTIRRKKRFAPFAKPPKFDDLAAVMTYFGYSATKAREVLNILTENDLILIRLSTRTE